MLPELLERVDLQVSHALASTTANHMFREQILTEFECLQGNNFDVSCPHPKQFQYIFPLDCPDNPRNAELSSAPPGEADADLGLEYAEINTF